MKRIRNVLLGWVLLLLGLGGLFLPLLPGVPLVIAALVVLSREYDWAQRLLTRVRRHLPSFTAKAQAMWRRARIRCGRGSPHISRCNDR